MKGPILDMFDFSMMFDIPYEQTQYYFGRL